MEPTPPPSENPYEAPRSDVQATPVGRGRQKSDLDLETGDWVLAVLCSGIGCIMGIVWAIQGKPKGMKMIGVSFLFAVLWNIVRFAVMAMAEK